MKLFVFHFGLKPLREAWIHLSSLTMGKIIARFGLPIIGKTTSLREGKLLFRTLAVVVPEIRYNCSHFCYHLIKKPAASKQTILKYSRAITFNLGLTSLANVWTLLSLQRLMKLYHYCLLFFTRMVLVLNNPWWLICN